jgi:hypothetical protein
MRGGLVCIAAVVLLTVTACTGPSASSSSAGPTLSVPPTLTPAEMRRQPQVSIPFSEQTWARGMRRFLFVAVIPHPSDVCVNYGFRSKMTMLVAYQTDCANFPDSRRHDLFFYVAVRNVTDQRATFALRNFTLESQDGEKFSPAKVGTAAPADFLPQMGTIGPTSNLFGYLTFRADAADAIPVRLDYVDGRQTLSVVFDGEPSKAK